MRRRIPAPYGSPVSDASPVTHDVPLEAEHPAWEMLRLAAPTVATMASYTTMQFVDGWMVTRITPADTVYLAAQGNGGIWSFLPLSIFAGLSGVVNAYVAQNLGAGKPERGPAYAWNAVWIGLAIWATVLLPLAVFIPHIFAQMGHAARLVELETQYARVLLCGAFVPVVTRSLSHYFYGMHRPGVTLVGALAGNITNLGLNYCLIYGNFGFPALGVAGSAVSTVIGTAVEAAFPMAVFLSPKFNRLYGTRAAWRLRRDRLADIFRIGWPPALMFGNEMICWAVFMTYLAGHFGTEHNAAGWIVLRYMHLSFMPAVGISYACTAMVGRCLGARRPDLASSRAKLGVAIAMGYMGSCAVLFILFRHPMVGVFIADGTPPDEAARVLEIGTRIMIVAAVFQLFDGMGIALLGVLRGAGDTLWPGLVTVVLAWTCIIGGGSALAFGVPQWGSLGPWAAAAVYIILLGLALLYRFRSGVWKTRKLIDTGPPGVAAGAAGVDPSASGLDANLPGAAGEADAIDAPRRL